MGIQITDTDRRVISIKDVGQGYETTLEVVYISEKPREVTLSLTGVYEDAHGGSCEAVTIDLDVQDILDIAEALKEKVLQ